MPSALLSPTTPHLYCSTPSNRRPEIPAKVSGWSSWTRGGWSELPGVFSGSPELLSTTSDMYPGSTVIAPILLGVLAGSDRRRSETSTVLLGSRREPPESSCVFSGSPKLGRRLRISFCEAPMTPRSGATHSHIAIYEAKTVRARLRLNVTRQTKSVRL